jgi:hypothetical protein
MKKSLERLMLSPRDFPLEITLSSGEKHFLPHPDHLQMHPDAENLIVYPDVGPFSLVVNPEQVVSIKPRAEPPRRETA